MNLKFCHLAVVAAVLVGGCNNMNMSHDHAAMSHATYSDAEIAAAKDMHNTVCPVSGDKVGDSKAVVIHDGKLYHTCCNDCVKEFNDSPDKFIKQMDANPEKYGMMH